MKSIPTPSSAVVHTHHATEVRSILRVFLALMEVRRSEYWAMLHVNMDILIILIPGFKEEATALIMSVLKFALDWLEIRWSSLEEVGLKSSGQVCRQAV